MLKFLINHTGWLVLGTIYGVMIGHVIGVAGARWRYFTETESFLCMVVCAHVGLGIGVCLDVTFARTDDHSPHMRSTTTPRERLLLALPVALIIYLGLMGLIGFEVE
jgi:hypothetical protein